MCVSELLLRAVCMEGGRSLRVVVRESGQNVKNVNGRGSTEYKVHTNIMHRSGEVMDKCTKHRFFTSVVLEIQASLYSIP